jgi:hypothetical protein
MRRSDNKESSSATTTDFIAISRSRILNIHWSFA